jgi:hypothetical protein
MWFEYADMWFEYIAPRLKSNRHPRPPDFGLACAPRISVALKADNAARQARCAQNEDRLQAVARARDVTVRQLNCLLARRKHDLVIDDI